MRSLCLSSQRNQCISSLLVVCNLNNLFFLLNIKICISFFTLVQSYNNFLNQDIMPGEEDSSLQLKSMLPSPQNEHLPKVTTQQISRFSSEPIYFEDSYTLDNYIHFTNSESRGGGGGGVSPGNKRQAKLRKIEEKNIQKVDYGRTAEIRQRKNSTQLSIFSWLMKDKQAQDSLLLTLDKELILKVYSYLRLSEVVVVSQVSSYMLSCYKSVWIYRNFFEHFQTDKFSSNELSKVIERSKLDHIKQLKQMYMGKNIRKNRQKYKQKQFRIKMKVSNGQSNSNSILEIFSISPKVKSGVVFIMDSHFQQILSSSFRGLKQIQINRCAYIKNISSISKCLELQKLCITFNEKVTCETLSPIFKRCLKLEKIELSECKNLDQNVFGLLKGVTELDSLTLKCFRQSFGKLVDLSQNEHLKFLNLDDSMISDDELKAALKELRHLQYLSIQGCMLLTNQFADFLINFLAKPECRLKEVKIRRISTISSERTEKVFETVDKKLSNKQVVPSTPMIKST